MSKTIEQLSAEIQGKFASKVAVEVSFKELNISVSPDELRNFCIALRDEFKFEILIDLCGVDYSGFGQSDWKTETASATGFSRGVDETAGKSVSWAGKRFASVLQLLSVEHNARVRVKSFCENDDSPMVPSVSDIWSSANWYERESFDLFGILYSGHPDLRRILTDYGFVGHPFRKDFPLIGEVEMRYDAKTERCVYEPVSIEPRVLVPRVIRDDERFAADAIEEVADNG